MDALVPLEKSLKLGMSLLRITREFSHNTSNLALRQVVDTVSQRLEYKVFLVIQTMGLIVYSETQHGTVPQSTAGEAFMALPAETLREILSGASGSQVLRNTLSLDALDLFLADQTPDKNFRHPTSYASNANDLPF